MSTGWLITIILLKTTFNSNWNTCIYYAQVPNHRHLFLDHYVDSTSDTVTQYNWDDICIKVCGPVRNKSHTCRISWTLHSLDNVFISVIMFSWVWRMIKRDDSVSELPEIQPKLLSLQHMDFSLQTESLRYMLQFI